MRGVLLALAPPTLAGRRVQRRRRRRETALCLFVFAMVALLSGCSDESEVPEGAKGGKIRYDCSYACGDDLARDRLRFKDVWCEWEGDHVLVHVRVENPLVVPTVTNITPAYENKDGGRHGTSFGSDRAVPAAGNSYTEAQIDAGSPEGVPRGTEISSCEPQVQNMDAVDEVNVKSDGDVTIVSQGPLGEEAEAHTSAAGGECESVEAPAPREPEVVDAPRDSLSAGTSYSLVFETSCGTFTVELDTKLAPETTASLVALARAGYFDDTVFHRIVPEFVIQGGDPTATGTGGPGYTTVDTPSKDTQYTLGTVAMAKTAAEPRGAAGSQFFVVTSDEVQLPGDYAVIGEVTSGFETVARIGGYGDAAGVPTIIVVVESIKISRGG